MNNNITNCPKCNSNKISFDISIGKLKCEYCGNIIENQIYNKELNNVNVLDGNIVSNGSLDINTEVVNLVKYKCPSCNNVIVQDSNLNDLKCPWCHSNIVKDTDESFTPIKKILPFTVNKDTAVNKINSHLDKLKSYMAPKIKKKLDPNNMVPIYVPFVLIDAELSGDFSGVGEHLIDSKYDSENNDITYFADLYQVNRKFSLKAYDICLEEQNNIITDQTTAIKNMITALNPYDTSEEIDFDSKYVKNSKLASYPLTPPKNDKKLNEKLLSVTKGAISRSTSYYDRGIKWEKSDINVKSISYSEVYLPLWLYYFTINKKKYYIAVNGRTEETAVHIPGNITKIIGSSLLIGLLIFLAVGTLAFAFIFDASTISSIVGTEFSLIDLTMFLPILYLLLIGLFIAIVVIIVRSGVKIRSYLGDNILNENDILIKKELNEIVKEDIKLKTVRTGRVFVKDRNDL